jgi:hypothetical protein
MRMSSNNSSSLRKRMPALLVAFMVAFLALIQLMRLYNVTTLSQEMEAQRMDMDAAVHSHSLLLLSNTVRPPPNDQKSHETNSMAASLHSNRRRRRQGDEDAMFHTTPSGKKTLTRDIGNRTTRVVKEPLSRPPPPLKRNISDRTELDIIAGSSRISNSRSSLFGNATLLHNHNNNHNNNNSINNNEQQQGDSYYYSRRTDVGVPRMLLEPPNHNNTIISMISMGRGPDTFLVERCIRSIRKSGGFTGYIMVYTDPKGWTRYQQTLLSWDPKVILMLGREEDLEPTTSINGTTTKKIPYREKKMAFKRFKTLLIDYLAYDPRVSDNDDDDNKSIIQHILYLDIDNVIANTLDPFFAEYYTLLQGTAAAYDAASSIQRETKDTSDDDDDSNTTSLHHHPPPPTSSSSFVYLYSDYGKPVWHTGMMMYHRHYAVGCLEAWRRAIDTKWKQVSDQKLLLKVFRQSNNNNNVTNNNNNHNCKPMRLPGGHFTFAKHGDLKNNNTSKHQKAIIHITDSTRAKMFPQDLMDAFLTRVLQLQPNETMVGNTTWEEVLPIRVMHR